MDNFCPCFFNWMNLSNLLINPAAILHLNPAATSPLLTASASTSRTSTLLTQTTNRRRRKHQRLRAPPIHWPLGVGGPLFLPAVPLHRMREPGGEQGVVIDGGEVVRFCLHVVVCGWKHGPLSEGESIHRWEVFVSANAAVIIIGSIVLGPMIT